MSEIGDNLSVSDVSGNDSLAQSDVSSVDNYVDQQFINETEWIENGSTGIAIGWEVPYGTPSINNGIQLIAADYDDGLGDWLAQIKYPLNINIDDPLKLIIEYKSTKIINVKEYGGGAVVATGGIQQNYYGTLEAVFTPSIKNGILIELDTPTSASDVLTLKSVVLKLNTGELIDVSLDNNMNNAGITSVIATDSLAASDVTPNDSLATWDVSPDDSLAITDESSQDKLVVGVGNSVDNLAVGNVDDENIGIAGTLGFGVGLCIALPPYMSEMTGTRIPGHQNYGNYIHTATGSVMVYIPKHYIKITSDNRYYVASIKDYSSEAEANAAGYFLPRCFIDGGNIISGYFKDKYPHNGIENNIAVSKKNLIPITSNGAEPGYGFADCTGNSQTPTNILGGALTVAKSRGNDFFTSTAFHDFDMMCLYKAHQQACGDGVATYAAWNDVLPYAPKGNNNNALADTNDSSVTYTSAGNADFTQRALAGSGNPFAKTTHNGQECGIADLNGNMYRISIGLTSDGINLYTLKESISFKDLIDSTSGANAAFDVTNFDSIGANPSSFTQIGGTAGWEGLGNGTNQVFSGETDRDNINYKIANAGLPLPGGHSSIGTVDFGNDKIYVPVSFLNLLVSRAGLNWHNDSSAGVAGRDLNGSRTGSANYVGTGSCLSVL